MTKICDIRCEGAARTEFQAIVTTSLRHLPGNMRIARNTMMQQYIH